MLCTCKDGSGGVLRCYGGGCWKTAPFLPLPPLPHPTNSPPPPPPKKTPGEDWAGFPKAVLFRGNLRGDSLADGMAHVRAAMEKLPGARTPMHPENFRLVGSNPIKKFTPYTHTHTLQTTIKFHIIHPPS